MKNILLLFTFVTGTLGLSAQDCDIPSSPIRFSANNMITYLEASGSMFDGNSFGLATYPNTISARPPATLFASGLWLGAFDPGGNLKLAASTYSRSSNNYDYYPGPLNNGNPDNPNDPDRGTVSSEDCNNWDKVWLVHRSEIEAFRADYADDGEIQGDYPNIFSWPGFGNPSFEAYNGFPLPPNRQISLAPYWDSNGNAIYEPSQGDYPYVIQSMLQPEMIAWSVFNDVGNSHNESGGGVPLQAEIQQTTWAYNCTMHPWLSDAIFTSYRVTNFSLETYDSLYIGLWNDVDLGCYTDDYVGAAPELSTYYAYNQDALDGTVGISCDQGVTTFGEEPPVQAITFLGRSLNHFTYSNNGGIDTSPPGTTDPNTVTDFYNLLAGRFIDGTPITRGGSGYNPAGGIPQDFAFPDNPNDPTGWSMNTENLGVGDRRVVGSHYVGSLPPSAIVTLDMAFTLHRHSDSNHLQTVNLMYDQVEVLQELYTNQFANACEQPLLCTDDCVWPGDANADGIANHYDLLTYQFERNEQGPERALPINWSPTDAQAWAGTQRISDANEKHADCNANGSIHPNDFEITRLHYDFTRPDYVAPTDVFQEGPELFFRVGGQAPGTIELSADNPSAGIVQISFSEDAPEVSALGFTVDYDPAYLNVFNLGSSDDYFEITNGDVTANYSKNMAGEVDIAAMAVNRLNTRLPSVILQIRLKDNYQTEGIPGDTTCLRMKNIVAYDGDGNQLDIGAQTLKITFGEGVPVSTERPLVNSQRFAAFPNPTTDLLQLNWQDITVTEYTVIDVAGRQLQQGQGRWTERMTVDVVDLPAGIYFLQLNTINGEVGETIRFVKL